MKASALNQINDKLKSIPDNFVDDILAYLNFLSFKSSENDWANQLSAKDVQLIQKGIADIKSGKILSHTDAMKKINAHIKEKTK